MCARPPREAGGSAFRLFGQDISSEGGEALVARLVKARPAGTGVGLVLTMNLDHVVRLRTDRRFQEAYQSASTVTLDGAPVWAYAKLRGAQAPRCPGSDLLPALLEALDPASHRPFFVVGSSAIADRLSSKLAARGFHAAAFAVPPLRFDPHSPAAEALAREIASHQPTHLILGLGAPTSEIFAHRHRGGLGDLHALCLGAAVEFHAGVRPRAPKLLRRIGLEWAFRLLLEPRRLARRYLVDAWGFIPAVLDDLKDVPPGARHRKGFSRAY